MINFVELLSSKTGNTLDAIRKTDESHRACELFGDTYLRVVPFYSLSISPSRNTIRLRNCFRVSRGLHTRDIYINLLLARSSNFVHQQHNLYGSPAYHRLITSTISSIRRIRDVARFRLPAPVTY